MQLEPKDPFMLAAGALQQVNVGVRPAGAGARLLYIHMVDVEYHQLMRAWLVCLTCTPPIIRYGVVQKYEHAQIYSV